MAISTVNVDFSAILQNAAQATGLLRVRLSQVGTVEDSETGDTVILPIAWQETTLTDGAATLALVPNKIIEPSCTYYEIQLKSVPDCPKACAKLLLSGIMYVPDEDCNVLDLLISPPSLETANTASGYASQAKQAAQVAENFAIQAGDRYDDVAEAAATALTDIGTAKQDALDAIGTAQSGATEAISTAEDAALQAIGQARGTALDDIGTARETSIADIESASSNALTAISTAQGTAIGAVQAEGNTQVGRVEDAGEDAIADVTAARDAAVSAVQAQQATSVVAVTAEGTRQTGLVTAEGTAQVNAVTQAGNGYVTTMQGLVSDAQAARDAAQTAQGLAEDAQTAAESASTDAQGYAGDASTSAGQAAQSASDAATSANDAADSATAAQASADSIAASAEQIQANAENITALETKTDITNKNVANIQALLNGTLYREETDSTAAYSKAVPTGAMPYASIDETGGKTVVWNQLNYNNHASYENSGITGTNNGNGTWTLNGTATQKLSIIFHSVPSTVIIAGHKYFLKGCPAGGGQNSYWLGFGGIRLDVGSGAIWEAADYQTYNFRLDIVEGVTFDNVTITPIYSDLTQMFGAGNEPTTVAEFEAMFPSIDPAYNAGELMSAGVTEAVSESKNLLKNTSASDWVGYTSNFSWSDGIITDTIIASAGGPFFNANKVSVVVGEQYTISAKWSAPSPVPRTIVRAFNADGNSLEAGIIGGNYNSYYAGFVITSNTLTFTISSANVRQIQCGFVGGQTTQHPVGSTVTVQEFQLERSSTATEYTPYFSRTLPIPSAVQALPGYGWSAGTAYNYIDFERKVYVQKVGEIDLGAATTIWFYSTEQQFFSTQLSDASNTTTNAIVQGYTLKSAQTGWANMQDFEFGIVNGSLRLHNSAYTSSADFKNSLQGKKAYYELATPIETDISSLLTDSTIEVEAGGTLTFKNQHGDDFRLPVPNEETFLVQATPELPTTDGTYTLQCTVTDGTPSVTWVTA